MTMFTEFAFILVCLHFTIIIPVEGRFVKAKQLPAASNDVQYAFIIFRHGIRSTINNIYGSEEAYLKVWPNGRGALTEDGTRLMLHVGQSLRTRYKNLMPEFDDARVLTTSTLSPRALMSAEGVVTGMFPPSKPIVKDNRLWQPMPVWPGMAHDKAHLFDEVEGNTRCPRYLKIRDSIIKEEMDKLTEDQKREITKINNELEKSELPAIKSLDDLFNVWDVYLMTELSEKPLTSSIKSLMPAMTKMAKFRLWSRMDGKRDGEHSILQYFTGPLLHRILEEMDVQKKLCESSTQEAEATKCIRLHLHGSHDLTVGDLVYALADKQSFMANPGDALILEMDKQSQVKLFLYSPLRNEQFQEFPLRSALCDNEDCSLENLKNGLENLQLAYSLDEWKKKCHILEGVDDAVWHDVPEIDSD